MAWAGSPPHAGQYDRNEHHSQRPDGRGLKFSVSHARSTAFQMAGPKPTPELIHQGLMALPITGGWAATHDQRIIKVGFRPPSPWTAAEDTREVYWNGTMASPANGNPGTYVAIYNGQRFGLGQYPTGQPPYYP